MTSSVHGGVAYENRYSDILGVVLVVASIVAVIDSRGSLHVILVITSEN